MKNLTIILSLLIIFTLSVSCGNKKEEKANKLEKKNGPIEQLDTMIELIEDFTDFAYSAAEDKILEGDEIEEYKERFEEIENIEEELLEKTNNDEETQKEFEEYAEKNKDKINITYEDFYLALEKIFECEGADKL